MLVKQGAEHSALIWRKTLLRPNFYFWIISYGSQVRCTTFHPDVGNENVLANFLIFGHLMVVQLGVEHSALM